MIRVALIDDHKVVRSGFAQLLALESDVMVCGQYSNAADAWSALSHHPVDVAILDISLPGENGLSLLARLRAQQPHFRALILSIYDTTAFVQSALDAGAAGYLTKRCGPEELVQAVHTVSRGGHYLCSDALRALRQLPGSSTALTLLTPREKQVFSLLVAGLAVKQVAQELSLSHKTVHVHRANVLSKLQCETTVDLIHFALAHHLLPVNHG